MRRFHFFYSHKIREFAALIFLNLRSLHSVFVIELLLKPYKSFPYPTRELLNLFH